MRRPLLDKQQLRTLSVLLVVLCYFAACSAQRRPNAHDAVMKARKVESLLLRATLLMRQNGDKAIDESFASLELARELSPRDSRVLDGLGCVEWRRKNYPLAEHFFKKALKQNPFNDRPYAHLALIELRRGHRRKAQKLFKKAIKLEPLNYRSRNNYAVFLIQDTPSQWHIEKSYQEMLRAAQSVESQEPIIEINLKKLKHLRVH